MTEEVCEVCGKKLTPWNRTFGTRKCTDCARGISPKQQQQAYHEFFERLAPSEQSIAEHPLWAPAGLIALSVLIALAATIAGGWIGGWVVALLGGSVVAGLINRQVIFTRIPHPLDRGRFARFWLGFAVTYWVAWFAAYFMMIVRAAATTTGSALLIPSLIAAVPAVLVGALVMILPDKKARQNMVASFQAWQQEREKRRALARGQS